jgi:hypothetical protein
LSHQRGKKPKTQNKTKKHHKVSQVQMQYSFSKFLACRCSSVVVSSKEERKKKKSLETNSPAHCCQPAVFGGFIYADLRSELNTHLAPQAMFT